MTDEHINIAIAEACGIISEDQWGPLYKTTSGWVRDCQDYVNDLNAMHEAEKVLEIDQQYVYGEELRAISGNVGPRGGHFIPNGWGVFKLATATPRERAEAFLRTIGKWEGGAAVNERPTPETDAIESGMFGQDVKLIADFARRLERERDESRDDAEKAKAYKRVMKEDNAKLRRELDELNKRLIEVCQYGVVCTIEREDLHKELDKAREELAAERAFADRLADALTACEPWVNQPCDVKVEANKALTAWEEARK